MDAWTSTAVTPSTTGPRTAWILDGTGKRFAVGTGGFRGSGPVHHVSLASPIVLPVGSPLQVMIQHQIGASRSTSSAAS